MTEPVVNIVIVEDDPPIRKLLRTVLESAELRVFEAATARAGAIEAATCKADLVIVDLGLPDADGLSLIADLRAWSAMPVIVLSARTQESQKIAALDAGADDYLTKPFSPGELLARVRAHLRRASAGQTSEPVVRVQGLEIDLALRHVRREGIEVHLTPIEFRLLAVLARERGKVLTHRQLLREVWGPSHVDQPHYLRIFMAQLRKKLEADPAAPTVLLTELGVGYRFAG